MRHCLSWKKGLVTGLFIAMLLVSLSLVACGSQGAQGPQGPPGPRGPAAPAQTASLVATPDAVELGMALVVTKIAFVGSGFEPGEMVAIELVGAGREGEDIPVAQGTANDFGAFSTAMDTMAKISDILGASWNGPLPDFSAAQPIAPDIYTVRATGILSDTVAVAAFTLLAP